LDEDDPLSEPFDEAPSDPFDGPSEPLGEVSEAFESSDEDEEEDPSPSRFEPDLEPERLSVA
jgi:hypothetical protein